MGDGKKRCLICKYMTSNIQNPGPYRGVIYNSMSKPVHLNLCRLHERELFILGQFRFLDKYEKKRIKLLEVDQDYGVIVALMTMLREYKSKQKELSFRRVS